MNPLARSPAVPHVLRALAVLASVIGSGTAYAADDADSASVTVNFAAEIGGQPVACGQGYADIGRTGGDMAVADFRLFVSGIALIDAGGGRVPVTLDDDGRWQDGQVALLDFEDGSDRCDNGTPPTNAVVSGQVPAGDYRGLELTVGVPFKLNHGDPTLAGSPLNLTAMFWNWRGGYRFLKVDFVPAGGMAAAAGAWMLHLGSTGCMSASRTTAPAEACANPNRVKAFFDGFDAERDVIVIDPAALLVDSDLMQNTPDTSPGCMSFPGDADCADVLPLAGLPYGDVPGGEQQLLTVRRAEP